MENQDEALCRRANPVRAVVRAALAIAIAELAVLEFILVIAVTTVAMSVADSTLALLIGEAVAAVRKSAARSRRACSSTTDT